MIILGYSGLHHSVPFKQSAMPGLPSYAYRMCQGFDSAATLIIDGKVVAAAAEERFTREKTTGAFPERSMRWCAEFAGISLHSVDAFAHGFSYEPLRESFELLRGPDAEFEQHRFREVYARDRQVALLRDRLGIADANERLVQVPHHRAHAASAFYMSGFSDCLTLVSDGLGERESMTLFDCRSGDMRAVASISAGHSLGMLYGVLTTYLGFVFNMDEYKVMGLAPHGDRSRYQAACESMVRFKSDGTYALPVLRSGGTLEERETHEASLCALEDILGPRYPMGAEPDQRAIDIAAAMQALTERCLQHTLNVWQERTGHSQLCMAGGVALNCVANGLLARSGKWRGIFVQPAAGDDGSSLGAACVVARERGATLELSADMPLWGPEFGDEAFASALVSCKADGCETATYDKPESCIAATAEQLASGKIVAWFQGRMEFGPRALGNRSILADVRDPEMRERINQIIKKREGFRPFAPMVTEEDASRFFEMPTECRANFEHMLFTAPVRSAYRDKLPAITHVDGSARVQTVSRESSPKVWALLKAVEQHTGYPVLLNTSFNIQEPIVCSPAEAAATFLKSGMHVLVLGCRYAAFRQLESPDSPDVC